MKRHAIDSGMVRNASHDPNQSCYHELFGIRRTFPLLRRDPARNNFRNDALDSIFTRCRCFRHWPV